MANLKRLLWVLAIFPWLDFFIRISLPSIIGSTWDDLFLLLIIILLFIEKKQENRFIIIPKSVIWPFYTFLFFSISSIVIHVVPIPVSIDVLRVIYEPMLFGLITMYLLDDEQLVDRFIKIMIISSVFIAIAGILQYVFKIDSIRWMHKKDAAQFRIVSVFSNPNALASYFNMILSFTVSFFFLMRDKKKKLYYLLASIPIFLALLLTFSRGAWIAFFLMVVYMVWVWNKKWLLVIPVISVLMPFIMPDSIIARFAKLFDPKYYQMSSVYGRISFWTEALIKMKEHPLIGVGLGMFGDSVPLRHNIPFSTWVDNHYLKLGAEIGIIGLIGFLLLLYGLFRMSQTLYKNSESLNEKAIILGISGVIITMSIQNVTASIWEALANSIYFYAFAGALFAIAWKQTKKGLSN